MIGTAALVIFLVGITAIVVVSLAGKVNIGLMLLVPLLPLHNILYRFHQFPLGKDFIDIAFAAMLAGWMVNALARGEKVFEPAPLNTVVFLLMGFTLVSLWQGSFYLHAPLPLNPKDERLQTWKNYMFLPLLYFITVNNIKTVKQIKYLLLCMFLAIFVVDFYTGRQVHYMGSMASRDKLVGTFMWLGPNQVAAFYVECITMLLGVYLLDKEERLLRLLYGTLIVLGVGITLFLYSRGAYLALLAGLLVISVLWKRSWIIPLVLVLIAWQTVLPQSVIERIKETRTADGELDSSSQKRLEMWKEAWGMFATNPVTGVGFDVIHEQGLKVGFKDTHNIYMKILAEQGMTGFIIFLSLLFTAFKSGWRLFRQTGEQFLKGIGLGFMACVAGMLTTNLFGDRWTYLQIGGYFWVFMGLATRGLLLAENEQEQADEYEVYDENTVGMMD